MAVVHACVSLLDGAFTVLGCICSGFTGAAAIIIGSSQLGKLLKLKLQRTNHVYEVWIEAIEEAGDVRCGAVCSIWRLSTS